MPEVVRRAVRDAGAELDHRRVVDQAVADQLVHEHEMAGVEHLELRPHAELADPRRHRAQHPGRVHHHVVAARGEVHRPAVERADLGQQLLDVREPLGRADHVGARLVGRQRRLVAAEHEVAAHAGGEVQDDVDVGRADPLDDRAVERRVAGAAAGLRVADVDVRDRRARARRLDRRVGDLLGRDRHVLAPAGGVAGARDGAGDEDLPVHCPDGEPALHIVSRPTLTSQTGCAMLAGGSYCAPRPSKRRPAFAREELRPVALQYDETEEYPLERAAPRRRARAHLLRPPGRVRRRRHREPPRPLRGDRGARRGATRPIFWVIAQGGFFAGPLLALGCRGAEAALAAAAVRRRPARVRRRDHRAGARLRRGRDRDDRAPRRRRLRAQRAQEVHRQRADRRPLRRLRDGRSRQPLARDHRVRRRARRRGLRPRRRACRRWAAAASRPASSRFEDCFVPDDRRLGGEGEGFRGLMRVFDVARVQLAARLARARARGARARGRATRRSARRSARPIHEFQAVSFRLADAKLKLDQARLLTHHAAELADAGAAVLDRGGDGEARRLGGVRLRDLGGGADARRRRLHPRLARSRSGCATRSSTRSGTGRATSCG